MTLIKMMKLAVVTGTLTLFSVDASAQGAYIKLGGGYNLGIGYLSGSLQTSKGVELTKISYGKGADLGLTGGYMFNSNLGLEVGASYLFGKKNKQKFTRAQNVGNDYVVDQIESESYSRMLFIDPAFVFSAGRSSINPYAKVGPIFGFGKIYEQFVDQSSGYFTETTEIHFELKSGVALGAKAAIGLDFNAASKMTFFTEVAFNSLAYAPNKGEITEYIVNGKDRTSDLSVSARESQYVKKLTNESTSRDKPTKFLKSSQPFSSFGLNLGLKINL